MEYHHLAIANAQDPIAYWTYVGHAHHHALAFFAKKSMDWVDTVTTLHTQY